MQNVQIGDLRLSLAEGKATFSSPSAKTHSQVEARLEEVMKFIDDWLQSIESPPRTVSPSPEEKRIADALNQFARGLYRTRAWRDKDALNDLVPAVASDLVHRWGGVTEQRALELAADAVEALK
jgi:hypothetical protein